MDLGTEGNNLAGHSLVSSPYEKQIYPHPQSSLLPHILHLLWITGSHPCSPASFRQVSRAAGGGHGARASSCTMSCLSLNAPYYRQLGYIFLIRRLNAATHTSPLIPRANQLMAPPFLGTTLLSHICKTKPPQCLLSHQPLTPHHHLHISPCQDSQIFSSFLQEVVCVRYVMP